MSSKIFTTPFEKPFLESLLEILDKEYLKKGRDFRRLAIVFGGKRPSLFLKQRLAQKMGRSFFPPRFFSIDEFIGYALGKKDVFQAAKDMDQCYLLYNLARKVTPHILKGRESFSAFLPWTREISKFIDHLDIENVPDEDLRRIQSNAEIGYEVPRDINRLLQSLVVLRGAYHGHMNEAKVYARGYQYLRAARAIDETGFEEFDQVLFCNFFYLNRCEEKIMRVLNARGRGTLIFQGDQRKWPVLERISQRFSCPLEEEKLPGPRAFDMKFHAGFDVHSQVCLVREILKNVKDPGRTVVVVPDPQNLVPLLSEITSRVRDFNISMGYPLKRSSLYALLGLIFKAQMSRGENGYYTKDYLKVLRHPLVKNLKMLPEGAAMRVLVHKIEEILTGQERTSVSGSLFIEPKDVLELKDLYELTTDTLKGMGISVSRRELKEALGEIHRIIFRVWEDISAFQEFCATLRDVMDIFLEKSALRKYPLNLKIAERIFEICDELEKSRFSQEHFPQDDIFKIFDAKMEREMVSFLGSPLKGMQVLGLFETRSLNFENVIVMDTNEGILPHLNIYEPLIPREVMISLNLDRLELEEEIQRYQFMRLISSAKNVHLVYQESRDKEKSRFVEELIWEEQKRSKSLEAVSVTQPSFAVDVVPVRQEAAKTSAMLDFLKNHTYSASSINTYLRDPMEFYYRYVLGLQEKEDLLDEPENRQVGTFVHRVLEEAFARFVGKTPKIDAKFRKDFMKIMDKRFEETFLRSMRADAFLLKAVMETRLTRFLEKEAEDPGRQVKEIMFLEKRFEDRIPLPSGERKFVYQLDRVDRMEDESILLLDYKTGSFNPMPKGIELIESMELSRESIRETVKSFQIPLYFFYLDKYFKDKEVNAAFYNLQTLEITRFIDSKMGYDRDRIKAAFLKPLDFILKEILDPETPFIADPAA